MDCADVRQQILEGKGNRLTLRRHLHRCRECADFQKQMHKVEALARTAIPFAAPEELSLHLQAMVPQAAQGLRSRAAAMPRPLSRRQARTRKAVQALMVLSIPLALFLGTLFWRQGLSLMRPWVGQAGDILPLIPDAIAYWGGRLGETLAPIREALLFIVSFLLTGLVLEQFIRSRRSQARMTLPR